MNKIRKRYSLMLSYDGGKSFFREMSNNKVEPLIMAMDEYQEIINIKKFCWGVWDNKEKHQMPHETITKMVLGLCKKEKKKHYE